MKPPKARMDELAEKLGKSRSRTRAQPAARREG